jgi:hypothetical protein
LDQPIFLIPVLQRQIPSGLNFTFELSDLIRCLVYPALTDNIRLQTDNGVIVHELLLTVFLNRVVILHCPLLQYLPKPVRTIYSAEQIPDLQSTLGQLLYLHIDRLKQLPLTLLQAL